MDLGAYAQIPNIDKIAIQNGIGVPRLRGYRLMTSEEPITHDDMVDFISGLIAYDLVHSYPFWNPNASRYEYGSSRREAEKRYLRVVEDPDGHKYRVPRWGTLRAGSARCLSRPSTMNCRSTKSKTKCGINTAVGVTCCMFTRESVVATGFHTKKT